MTTSLLPRILRGQAPDARTLALLLLPLLVALHLGNAVVPAVDHDESITVNIAATLATYGEHGNTWQVGRLVVPDRSGNTGPPLVLPVALAWKLGIRDSVGMRLATVTPYFLGFLVLFWKTLEDWEARFVGLLLLLAIPDWAVLSARVIGEFAALFLVLAGSRCLWCGRLVAGALLWGLAAITKLSFLPGLVLGWIAWCLTTRRGWGSCLLVPALTAVPMLLYLGVLRLRYGATTDFAMNLQGLVVLFYPRNLPLNVCKLNQYFPWFLVAAGYAWAWLERRAADRVYFLACLSGFWMLWQLLGSRGWVRYVLPGLILLVPAVAAAVRSLIRGSAPLFVKAALVASLAAFAFLGFYQNAYWIWISYKDWRLQRQVVSVLETRADRRLLGEGLAFPYPQYQWLTGRRFENIRATEPQPGDIAMVMGEERFLQRESTTGRAGRWKQLFDTPPVEIYEYSPSSSP